MNATQKLLNALAVLARARGNAELAEYFELAAVTVGAVSDDKEQLEALTEEILERAQTKTMPTPAERQAVRDRRQELADQIARIPPR